MSWTSAPDDLRSQLGDGPTDKLSYRKAVIGQVNGNNQTFKTFEFRRVTNLTTAEAPLGVYVNGEIVGVDTDSTAVGEFVLTDAPDEGATIEASYYIQWFIDSELTQFLNKSTQWLGLGNNYLVVPVGLQTAGMLYAAKLACESMALRVARYASDTYQMADAPKADSQVPGVAYMKMAENYFKQASDARKNYYERNDEALAPLFANIPGVVFDVPPKR